MDEALQVLGVSAKAGFDEILKAKNRKLAAHDGDMDKIMQIEAAYDIIFMQSMKRRMTGEVEVSTSVRYADVPATQKKGGGQRGGSAQKTLLSKAGVGVAIAVPTQQQASVQVAVFTAIGLGALAQALLESPEAQLSETAGFPLALAIGYSIYSLSKDKKVPLGKSVGLTVACLVAGTVVGSLIQNWLRVDIVPLGSFGSPGVFVAEFTIVAMGLGCAFLI